MIGQEKNMLPDFPRTVHLPWKVNPKTSDKTATEREAACIFVAEDMTVEEKVDGANAGMMLHKGNPIIRNRNHLLNKAFIQRKTAAKMQFASIFGWFYSNIDKFEAVNERLGFEASIYGEWMYAVHGIQYDKLPALWIPYDIYDWQEDRFLPSSLSRAVLNDAGFHTPTLLHTGPLKSYEQLEALCNGQAVWSADKREGVYVKVNDKERLISRFKMVREGFVQGGKWSDDRITKNQLS